jgi:transposase
LRAQVEYLAGEGLSETEIARRLGLSREEVQLAINLSRGNRRINARAMDAPVWSNAGGQQG